MLLEETAAQSVQVGCWVATWDHRDGPPVPRIRVTYTGRSDRAETVWVRVDTDGQLRPLPGHEPAVTAAADQLVTATGPDGVRAWVLAGWAAEAAHGRRLEETAAGPMLPELYAGFTEGAERSLAIEQLATFEERQGGRRLLAGGFAGTPAQLVASIAVILEAAA